MKQFRITKYNPGFRNNRGHYMYDHWTEISDVGKTLEGELVTKEMYFTAEADYINAIIQVLFENKVTHLRLVAFDKKLWKYCLLENKDKWYHRTEFESFDLFEDKKVYIDELETVLQMLFRGYGFHHLEIKDKCFIHLGYDMYLYIGVDNLSKKLRDKLNKTSIFIEDFTSPYYYKNIIYIVSCYKGRSKYVSHNEILQNISVDEIKRVMKLSDEHPGYVYTKMNKKIAGDLSFQGDFEKYSYYIGSENKDDYFNS